MVSESNDEPAPHELNDRLESASSPPYWNMWIRNRLAAPTIVVAGATVISLFGSQHFVADLFCHFRVQYCVAMVLAGLVFALLRGWKMLLLCLVVLGINCYWVGPYLIGTQLQIGRSTFGQSTADRTISFDQSKSFKILTLNVFTGNQQYAEVQDLIAATGADFVVLLEPDRRWIHGIKALEASHPYSHFVPEGGNFGIAFYSKYQWSDLQVVSIEPLRLPSLLIEFNNFDQPSNEEHVFNENSIDQSAGREILETARVPKLQIIATHPIPPMDSMRTQARDDQLAVMAESIRQDCPAMMLGDFNQTPWSPRFADVLSAGSLRDSGLGFGVHPTWYVLPDYTYVIGGLKIDHVLINSHVKAIKHSVQHNIGSDHRGVLVEFALPSE